MASYPTIIDRSWQHARQRAPPLYGMPSMWQPKLNQPNVYHMSHCDFVQKGWRKWSAEHPDWYARRAEAQHPDWYNRRVNIIRSADTTERLWPWELTSRPTEKRVYGLTKESPRPVQRGYQAQPHTIDGQIPMPKWGLYNPPHYEEPSRVEPLPSIHVDDKRI